MEQRRCPSRDLGWGEPLAGFHWEGDDPILIFHVQTGLYMGCSKPAKFVNLSLPAPKINQMIYGHLIVKHDRTGYFSKCAICNETVTLFPNFDLSSMHSHIKLRHKESVPIFMWDEEKLGEHFRWWDDLIRESRTGNNGDTRMIEKNLDDYSIKSHISKSSSMKSAKRQPLTPRQDSSNNYIRNTLASSNRVSKPITQQKQIPVTFNTMASL